MMVFHKSFIIIVTLIFIMLNSNIIAKENKIIAVVNGDHPIWQSDLTNKLKFLNIINKVGVNDLLKQEDFNNILTRQIITDYLLKQEANKYNFSVSELEVENYIKELELLNKLPVGSLVKTATKNGFSKNEFLKYVRDVLLVDNFKRNFSLSRTKVAKKEIDSEIEKFLNFNGKREYELLQISVFEYNNSEDSAKNKIQVIYKQLNKSNFKEIAQNLSEDLYAKQGGEIGWVAEAYLTNKERSLIQGVAIGDFTLPMKIGNSYKIYFVKNVRTMLQLNPSNPDHMKQLRQIAQQKIIVEKAQVLLEDYISELYRNSAVTIY